MRVASSRRNGNNARELDTTEPAHDHPKLRGLWMVLIAAFLGWMFDGVELGIFPLVARPALQEMQAATGVLDKNFVQMWMG